MLPSITSRNELRKETLSLIVNDPEDPCNPTAVVGTGGGTPTGGDNDRENPTDPTPALCSCVTNNTTILDLGMTQISWGDIPTAVMNFRMGNSNPDYGDTDLANSIYHGPSKSNCYQANMSLCCLTDYFRLHAHMFVKGSTNGNGYVETRTFEMTGIDDNTIVQIYFIQGSVDSVASPQNDKLFLHIPTSDFDSQITSGVYGTPGSIVNAGQLAGAAGWSTNVNQITLQIPQNQQNAGTVGPYILERLFNDVNNGSSTYLTKGGVTWDTASSSPTEDDGYWEMGPPAIADGAVSNYNVGASSNINSITKILSDANGGPSISTNATQDWRTYSFNIEVQLDCQGSTPNSVEIIPNVPAYTMGTTIGTSSNVPVTQPCPVNPSATPLPRLGTVQPESVSMSTLQASGGALQITLQDIVNQSGQNLPASNYEIIQSKVYIVENTPNFNVSNEIEYNNPSIAVPDGVKSFTPTYQTFIDNKGNEVTQLNWLQKIADNLGNGKFVISFIDEPQRDSFERHLKIKQIGNVETTTTSTQYTPAVRGASTTRAHNSVPGYQVEKSKDTYGGLSDWITRSVGPNIFGDTKVIYNENGTFNSFEIRKSPKTRQKIGWAPIDNTSKEIFASTYSSWSEFKEAFKTTSISGITTESYTGYTNFSAYTDTRGNCMSSDLVFDLHFPFSAFTGTTVVPVYRHYSGDTLMPRRVISDSEGDELDPTNRSYSYSGTKDRGITPMILPPALSYNDGPINLPRGPENYLYYEVPETTSYRFQYKACLYFNYEDNGYCDYLNNYRNLTQGTFPTNDMEYKQLINAAIIYQGGPLDNSNLQYAEGNVAKIYTNTEKYSRKNTPTFGFNSGEGIQNFKARVYLEKTLSGTTSAVTMTEFTVGLNEVSYPEANEYLTLDLLPTDNQTNYYNCSGSTTIFTRKFDVYLDSDVINLTKGDIVKLKLDTQFMCTTKNTNTGYTSNIKLSLGQDTYTNSDWVYKPWYRITHYPSTAITNTQKFYWNPIKEARSATYISGGTGISVSEQGTLSLVPREKSSEVVYSNNKLNTARFNKLTFLDIPYKDYVGPLTLIPTPNPTNHWVKAIENSGVYKATPMITDYYIHADNMLQRDCIGYNCDSVYWNLPISDSTQIDDPFSNPRNTIIIQNRVKVRGKSDVTTVYKAYNPTVDNEISNYNVTPNPRTTFNTIDIVSQNCSTDEDKTIYFKDNSLIIDGKVVDIKSNSYDISTPSNNPLRKEYCKCGSDNYIEVNPGSLEGCLTWCCANAPKRGYTDDIYGCAESTVTQREFINKLGPDSINYGGGTNKPKGVVLGKDPKQPKQI